MLAFNLFQFVLVLTLLYVTHQTSNDANVQVLHQWSFVDFLYPSQQSRLVATTQRLYIPQNVAILDSDYFFSQKTSTKRIFVTTPQFRTGIPATVSEISKETNINGEYLLKPFPNWDSLGSASCEFAISVYRIYIDRCGLLWVLDTGRVDGFGNVRRACRPKLLIYDLNDGDTLRERYEFPDGTINERSNLITLVTESYQEDCRDSVAYIADVNAYGLVVFDLANRNSWRIEHKFFYPFPNHGTLTVAGVTFDLLDGVFGLTLGPINSPNRKLYFHSLASLRESWVSTSVLKNTTIIENPDLLRNQFTLSEEARDGQSSLEVMTDDGILIFSSLPQNAIVCWNSSLPFTKRNLHIVYQSADTLQFISGMKLKRSKTLLITSSRLQNYIVGNLNYTDAKYRLVIIDDVNELLKGTPCKGVEDSLKPTSAQKPSGFRPSSPPFKIGSPSTSSTPKRSPDFSHSHAQQPPVWHSST